MADKVIKKTELVELLSRLMKHHRLYAPVRQRDMANYEEISAPGQVDLSLSNTTLSPKSIMLPQSESMFEFTLDRSSQQAAILRETEKDHFPRLIFGIRPCDAKAFQLLDHNFNTPSYKDPWWVRRR